MIPKERKIWARINDVVPILTPSETNKEITKITNRIHTLNWIATIISVGILVGIVAFILQAFPTIASTLSLMVQATNTLRTSTVYNGIVVSNSVDLTILAFGTLISMAFVVLFLLGFYFWMSIILSPTWEIRFERVLWKHKFKEDVVRVCKYCKSHETHTILRHGWELMITDYYGVRCYMPLSEIDKTMKPKKR